MKLTLNADGITATATPAVLSDVVSTLLTPNSALTGVYKYAQTALVAGGAAMFMNKRHTGAFMNFGASTQA